jgi:hypothetical protein
MTSMTYLADLYIPADLHRCLSHVRTSRNYAATTANGENAAVSRVLENGRRSRRGTLELARDMVGVVG